MFETIYLERRRPSDVSERFCSPYLTILLVICPCLLCLSLVFLFKSRQDALITPRERSVVGIVTGQTADGKGSRTDYSFSYDGRTYYEHESKDSTLTVGQSLTVYFDSNDPSTSSLIEYHKLSNEDQRRMFCFIYLFVGVVIVLTILHVFMWNRKKPEVESLSEV
jgi:hypothetical protein